MTSTSPPQSLEAKLVVLGSQGVGKTSLVHRFVKHAFIPPSKAQSTVGASFVTTRTHVDDTTIRLQIWDTAGQERFRSISRLYYRGAQAAILCYDVTSSKSFDDIGFWLREIREYAGSDTVVQIVGTKADVVLAEPEKREVSFERCIEYAAEHLNHEVMTPGWAKGGVVHESGVTAPLPTPYSNRSSGYWAQELVWDCAHEVSAKDGEGVEEVFRVIARKLVEQHSRKMEHLQVLENMQLKGRTPGVDGGEGYFDLPKGGTGSFRVGCGDRRKSWLGIPLTPGGLTTPGIIVDVDPEVAKGVKKGRCC
jgi:small GTP-binding protein